MSARPAISAKIAVAVLIIGMAMMICGFVYLCAAYDAEYGTRISLIGALRHVMAHPGGKAVAWSIEHTVWFGVAGLCCVITVWMSWAVDLARRRLRWIGVSLLVIAAPMAVVGTFVMVPALLELTTLGTRARDAMDMECLLGGLGIMWLASVGAFIGAVKKARKDVVME